MFDEIFDTLFDQVKKLFFPEEWMQLDAKFSKFELFAMMLINKRKEIIMTELAEYINTPMSTATGIVDRLVKTGCVQRERNETDRRIVVLRLTEKGEQTVVHLKEVISGYFTTFTKEITPEEQKFLISIFTKLMNSMNVKATKQTIETQSEVLKKISIE